MLQWVLPLGTAVGAEKPDPFYQPSSLYKRSRHLRPPSPPRSVHSSRTLSTPSTLHLPSPVVPVPTRNAKRATTKSSGARSTAVSATPTRQVPTDKPATPSGRVSPDKSATLPGRTLRGEPATTPGQIPRDELATPSGRVLRDKLATPSGRATHAPPTTGSGIAPSVVTSTAPGAFARPARVRPLTA